MHSGWTPDVLIHSINQVIKKAIEEDRKGSDDSIVETTDTAVRPMFLAGYTIYAESDDMKGTNEPIRIEESTT